MGMYLIAAFDLTSLLSMVGVVLKVAIGLGAVIFVHELGHFLVALACGVKVEKFMVGFDIGGYKLSWRRGETIYGIGILPLGGYVKMLGQDDDPAHIAEQMKKSSVDANSANAKAIKGPNGETYYVDRRSYLAKTVPQRMAILSAGVVMNVIFAFIFAVIAYGMGVPYIPSIVSETTPGSPAWRNGIQPGDEIVKFGNRTNPTFVQLKGSVTLGDIEHGIACEVRRPDGKIVNLTLTPQQHIGRLATIGIGMPSSLTLAKGQPVIMGSPAARAKLVQPAPDKPVKEDAGFVEGDEVVRVGGVPVKTFEDFAAQFAKQPGRTLPVTIRRQAKADDKKPATSVQPSENELTFEVPPQSLRRFDFAMKMGPITAVRLNSPAAAAGFMEGDVITHVDGKKLGEGASPDEKWDAETLPDYLRRAADAGRDVEFTVDRAKTASASEAVKLHVKPQVLTTMSTVHPPGAPMGADEIGIAYRIDNEVAVVTPNTPAAADLAPGDRILQAKIVLPEGQMSNSAEPTTVKLITDEPGWLGRFVNSIFGGTQVDRNRYDWPELIDLIQFIPDGTVVELATQRGDDEPRTVKLSPISSPNAFVAWRGFCFMPLERIRKAGSFAEQIRYGWDETSDSLKMVFRFLKKLGTQVPISALGGPVTIAKAAGYSAEEGISSLLVFLTMLSANLAVLNFLPIPLLDGGHIVFLAYEGIRGRPANERFVVALHTAGFVFIVSLMLYVLALDLNLIPRNL